MKRFSDHITRGVTGALFVHGILVFLIGLQLFAVSRDYLKHPCGTLRWRIYPAVAGSILAVLAGAAIATFCKLRQRRSFDGSAAACLSATFKTLFVAEVVVVFGFGSMILDCGEMARRMLLWAVVLNLFLLGWSGRKTKSKSDDSLRE